MNCIIVDDDRFSQTVIKKLVRKTSSLNLVAVCDTAVKAIDILKDEAIDLILLDILMPEMSGFEFLESLKEPPQIIIISGEKDFALDAYDYQVTDFLAKPVKLPRFLQAIDRASEIYKQQQSGKLNQWLFVKDEGILHKIDISTILAIEAMADYVSIYTEDHKYIAHSTMHNILSMLPEEEFIRIHRSHIISMKKLEVIEGKTAILGDHLVPIGTTYYSRLMNNLNVV